MPLPESDTLVSYPDGDVASTGTVVHVEPLPDGQSAVLLDRTAFHAVDTAWPTSPRTAACFASRDRSSRSAMA